MLWLTRIACGVCAFLLAFKLSAADLRSEVEHYRRAHEADIVAELDALTRLKSVAADPDGLLAMAGALTQALEKRGFEVAALPTAPGFPPVVFGALHGAHARRTVLFYAHYDGQPVTLSQWSSDPFVPVMRSGTLTGHSQDVDWRRSSPPFDPEWRLFGRATGDDKASIVAFLAAFDALTATHISPSVNIKVLWEGEEEAGSEHLGKVLRDHQKLLATDLFLIGDGPVHQTRRPLIYFGARGTLGLEATIYGPLRALHDGHYGNWVPNPAALAATLIGQMRDDDGKILIPGFADTVRPLTPAELQALESMPPVEDELKREFGIAAPEGRESLSASIMRPALNVRGLRSGQVGDAAANAIPVNAVISMDFRLVPDQTPAAVRSSVERFLIAHGWTLVGGEPDLATRLSSARLVRLAWESGYPGLRSDMSSPAAKAVIAAANKAARSPVVVVPMMGGSVPLYLFADISSAPIIGLPIANHDDNQHAANENVRLQNLWDGINSYAALMAGLTW